MSALGTAAILLAALPLGIALVNLALLLTAAARDRLRPLPASVLVSILIPARNEEANIEACVRAALTTTAVDFEVLVMDDGSEDRTAALVAAIAAGDARVRLLRAPALPAGWSGKGHALLRLAEAARGSHLLFVDADVRLAPTAARALLTRAFGAGAALVSGVPAQRLPGWGPRLTVPAINLLLLGYYPLLFARMLPRFPGFAAGCGQLMLVERRAYLAADGHAPIRHSLHDGLTLPRLLRRAGHRTDLTAGWQIASCCMYQRLGEAWRGFAKNAREGMATPLGLPVWTLLLAGGHLLPPLLLLWALIAGAAGPATAAAAAWALSLAFRLLVGLVTREGLASVLATPATVVVALAIQWQALLRDPRRAGTEWRGRRYDLSAGQP